MTLSYLRYTKSSSRHANTEMFKDIFQIINLKLFISKFELYKRTFLNKKSSLYGCRNPRLPFRRKNIVATFYRQLSSSLGP